MNMNRYQGLLILVPLLFGTAAEAEKGALYNSGKAVWRTSYGECWTTRYRDKNAAPTDCFAVAKPEGDADGDGVVDSQDRCPGTRSGSKVDARGCERDSDGDGVVDGKDRCPDTPAGARVNARGCELDSDGDGVVDGKDRCPNTPQGATVDDKGCALGIVLQNVQFRLNSGELTTESQVILDKVAASLKARSDITSVMVIGHTDASGAATYNQSLSERRASSVADYLVSQGVDRAILGFKGMGESEPIADNTTAEGRAKNRRVELKLN
jgi:OmpA-OmpF porin, OOP family